MVVHRRRYLKIRAEIRRLEAEHQAKAEATKEHESLPMDVTYRSLPADTSTYRRRQVTKKEAVLMIEKAWIRKRQRDDGRKIREFLRGVPYACRRSYVKYYDLKFKTIKLKTDVETFQKSLPR